MCTHFRHTFLAAPYRVCTALHVSERVRYYFPDSTRTKGKKGFVLFLFLPARQSTRVTWYRQTPGGGIPQCLMNAPA